MLGQKVVKIYPIPCALTNGTATVNANIIKLTQNGFICNSLDVPLKVHDVHTATFVLPLTDVRVETQVVIFRTYDEFKGVHGLVQPGNHVNQILFKNPSSDLRKIIFDFLVKIDATKWG